MVDLLFAFKEIIEIFQVSIGGKGLVISVGLSVLVGVGVGREYLI